MLIGGQTAPVGVRDFEPWVRKRRRQAAFRRSAAQPIPSSLPTHNPSVKSWFLVAVRLRRRAYPKHQFTRRQMTPGEQVGFV